MYYIIYSKDDSLYQAIQKTEEQVNEAKEQGWTEQGGVSISSHSYGDYGAGACYIVAQAMVKKEE